MYKTGVSLCGIEYTDDVFAQLAENNILDVEISDSYYENGFDFKYAKELAVRHGINIWSMHLPFGPFEILEPSSFDKNVRDFTVNRFSEFIKAGSEIGIKKFVVHPSGEPIEDDVRSERLRYSRESLSRMADTAEKCVEDLPRTCLGHFADEMEYLTADDERLKICFDTNHIIVQNPEDVIKILGDKIVTLHVSDFDFVNERHWLPGEGKINWNKVVSALESISYDGVWMYEINFKTPKTIIRDRDLNAYDFRRNSDEIQNGLKPTVFSRPKPNLGMWE